MDDDDAASLIDHAMNDELGSYRVERQLSSERFDEAGVASSHGVAAGSTAARVIEKNGRKSSIPSRAAIRPQSTAVSASMVSRIQPSTAGEVRAI